MKECVYEYLAQKVIDDIRSSQPIGEELAYALYEHKIIDALRMLVHDNDFDLLLERVRTGREKLSSLALGMMKYLLKQSENQALLIDLWKEHDDYNIKLTVVFRLLDIADLNNSKHEMLYAFVKENWARLMDEARKFASDSESVIDVQKKRLADPSFPKSKHWIYLCMSLASEDTAQIEVLLDEYADSDVSIVAKVVAELKQRLSQQKNG